MNHEFVRRLEKQPNSVLFGLSLLLTLLVATADHMLSPSLSLSLLYLLPISLAAWYLNRWAGIFLVLLCTVTWLSADLARQPEIALGIHLWNALIRLGVFAVVSTRLSALRIALDREKQDAYLDPLTSAVNQRFLLEMLDREAERSRRYGYPLALAYLGLDNFRAVNERGGQSFGDRILQQIAHSIQQALRTTDTLARVGGDEFAILMPHADQNAAKAVMVRVYRDLLSLNQQADWQVGFSIGLISCDCAPAQSNQILAQAQQLMHQVKRSGKNRIEYQTLSL